MFQDRSRIRLSKQLCPCWCPLLATTVQQYSVMSEATTPDQSSESTWCSSSGTSHITPVVLCHTNNLNQVGNEPTDDTHRSKTLSVSACEETNELNWCWSELIWWIHGGKECSLCADGFVSAGRIAKQEHEAAGHLSFTETLSTASHYIKTHTRLCSCTNDTTHS